MDRDPDDPPSSPLNITGPADYESENVTLTGNSQSSVQSSQSLTRMSSQSSVPESQQSLHLNLADDDSEFDPSSQNTSTPNGKTKKFMHRKHTLEEPPLTEEQIRADSRYIVRELFKLRIIQSKEVMYYQCISCLPANKLVWTSKTAPYTHMRRHLESSLHNHDKTLLARFEALILNKGGIKHPSSDSSASSSKKPRHSSTGNDPLHLRLSSQKDFEQDTLLEVVQNMLPFEVLIFNFFNLGCTQCSGSGSAWIRIQIAAWIRIRIQNADLDTADKILQYFYNI